MDTSAEIVKSSVLPIVKRDVRFDGSRITSSYWKQFALLLAGYEKDAKPVYAAIYSLELEDPEQVITVLPEIYSRFIKELAESHVLGTVSECTDYLLQTRNAAFAKEVRFFETMERVIKKMERERIKKELPEVYDRLTFELAEKDIALAAQKKGRADLKAKMKAWDKECAVVPMEIPVIAMIPVTKKTVGSKVISLFWVKYAIAACGAIAIGTWVYVSNSKADTPQKEVVVIPKEEKKTDKDTLLNPKTERPPQLIENDVKEENKAVDTKEKKEPTATNNSRKIPDNKAKEKKTYNIVYNDITLNLVDLERKKQKTAAEQEEYNRLIAYKNKYTFDGTTLVVYKKPLNKAEYIFTSSAGLSYFYDKVNYYKLENTETPLDLIVVKDPAVKEELEIIRLQMK